MSTETKLYNRPDDEPRLTGSAYESEKDDIVEVWIVDACGYEFAGPQAGGIRVYDIEKEIYEQFDDLSLIWDYIKEHDIEYKKEIIINEPNVILPV